MLRRRLSDGPAFGPSRKLAHPPAQVSAPIGQAVLDAHGRARRDGAGDDARGLELLQSLAQKVVGDRRDRCAQVREPGSSGQQRLYKLRRPALAEQFGSLLEVLAYGGGLFGHLVRSLESRICAILRNTE